MRKIPIEYVRDGDILAKNLYNNSGGMLLKEGTRLDNMVINKLKIHGYLTICIKDKYTEEEIEEIIKPEFIHRIYTLQQNLNNIIRDSAKGVQVDMKKANHNVNELNYIISEIIQDIMSNNDVLGNLASISIYDDYTLTHSLNMMMLSTVIAQNIGLSLSEIKKMAIGCVFHDIGKTFLPIDIINKPGRFTDEEFNLVKTHTEKGYKFLTENTNLPATSRNIALCHHERVDGSGYPGRLNTNKIHKFSKIAAIGDVFDALSSDRPYRRALPINEAMEYILGCNNHFDLDLIIAFSKAFNPFPKDTFVYLSNHMEGIIYEVNPDFHTRPKIKIYGEQGKMVSPYIIDLMKYNNIVIEKVIYVFSFDKNN